MSDQFSRNIVYLGNILFPFKSTKGFSMPKLSQLFDTTPPAIKRWINGILPRRPMMDNIANIVSMKFRLRQPITADDLNNVELETLIKERGGNLGAFDKDEMRRDESFGKRMRIIREKLDLSVEGFAKRLGVGIDFIESFEAGEIPDNRILDNIVREFKVSKDWLLTGESKSTDTYAEYSKAISLASLKDDDFNQIVAEKEEMNTLIDIIENFDIFFNTKAGLEFIRKLYQPQRKRNLIENLKFLFHAKKLTGKLPANDIKEIVDIAAKIKEE